MIETDNQLQRNVARGVLLLILGSLLMIGCATTKNKKTSKEAAEKAVASAQSQLQSAKQADAPTHSPQEYQRAMEALASARNFLNQGKYSAAINFAEQAAYWAQIAKEEVLKKAGRKIKGRKTK